MRELGAADCGICGRLRGGAAAVEEGARRGRVCLQHGCIRWLYDTHDGGGGMQERRQGGKGKSSSGGRRLMTSGCFSLDGQRLLHVMNMLAAAESWRVLCADASAEGGTGEEPRGEAESATQNPRRPQAG